MSGPYGELGAALAAALASAGPCPNTPPCEHSAALHDIYTEEGPRPICCAEGCECRATPEPDPAATPPAEGGTAGGGQSSSFFYSDRPRENGWPMG